MTITDTIPGPATAERLAAVEAILNGQRIEWLIPMTSDWTLAEYVSQGMPEVGLFRIADLVAAIEVGDYEHHTLDTLSYDHEDHAALRKAATALLAGKRSGSNVTRSYANATPKQKAWLDARWRAAHQG